MSARRHAIPTLAILFFTTLLVFDSSAQHPTGVFKGQLVAAENVPLSNVQVMAYKGSDPSRRDGIPYTTVTDVTGSFSVPNLPFGDYVVDFVPPDSKKPLKTTAVRLSSVNSAPFLKVSLGRLTMFRVQLTKGPADLAGEVYLNGITYGQGSLRKQLLAIAGTHRVTAKSDECKNPEERVETFFPSTEAVLEIQLHCRD